MEFKIPLKNCKKEIVDHAFVSERDFVSVSEVIWSPKEGYAWNGKHGYMHRFILGLEQGDKRQVDHKNRIRSDNRRENLRFATQQENMQNRPKREGTSSQYRGVTWHKLRSKWLARIWFNNKGTHLGSFKDEIDAACAYDKSARELDSEFTNLNFPEAIQWLKDIQFD